MNLSCFEIKKKINFNNQKIEQLLSVDTFVLNKKIQELVKENKELSDACPTHEDDGTGVCKHCGIKL